LVGGGFKQAYLLNGAAIHQEAGAAHVGIFEAVKQGNQSICCHLSTRAAIHLLNLAPVGSCRIA
jgi:hypothetical protein